MKHYPVVIIGSGPAGSACAKALKDAGVRCLVLEKSRLPRPKTCSGVIYGQSQELLLRYFGALPPMKLRSDPGVIRASNAVLCEDGGDMEPYIWELPKDGRTFSRDWINVWRSEFDYWLLAESGAKVMERTRFLRYERTGDGFVIKARRPSHGLIEFGCDYLVGADGAISGVRRAFDPVGASQAKSCVAGYSYYEFDDMGSLKDDWWYVFLRPEFGDIIACVHRKDDMLALSVGGFLGVKLKDCERNFVRHLTREYGVQFGQQRCVTCCGIKIAPPCLGGGNLLLAGDAAGMIYLNGEGISAALDTGYRAGMAIARSVRDGATDAASAYLAGCEDILRHREHCLDNMRFVVPRPQSGERTAYTLPVSTPGLTLQRYAE